MVRIFKNWLRKERGQALPIVLCLLAIGGLTIAVSLDHISTSLKGSQIVNESVRGIYAADAGVEYAVWHLVKGMPTFTGQLAQQISGMAVDVTTDNIGTRILQCGTLVQPKPGVHVGDMDVHSTVTDVGGGVYQYTITVTRLVPQGNKHIKLEEVGATLPIGYSYQLGSAAGDMSTSNPNSTGNASNGAQWVKWTWQQQGPDFYSGHLTQYQRFNITGTGGPEGYYAWVVANDPDVDIVGEYSGTLYKITATARRPEDGRIRAKIVADIIMKSGAAYIMLWQISK